MTHPHPPPPTTAHIVITCEHGGSLIPPAWRGLFVRHSRALMSHEGFDAGALTLARELAQATAGTLFFSKTSRLLVDLNRSPGHPQLFSPITRKLSHIARQNILNQCYRPYRREIETHISDAVARGQRVIHIASHSFTPELDATVRDVDIGLLYDPARKAELALCLAWQAALVSAAPLLKVRRNQPYKGTSDGLTAALREVFPESAYLGIELEVNQKFVFAKNRTWPRLRQQLVKTLRQVLESESSRPH